MCLILFAIQQHPDYPLILAANRDEYYQRPSATAQFWSDCPNVLAGRDLEANGTWLGISRAGKFAAVTNFYSPDSTLTALRSRGELVSKFLQSEQPIDHYRATLKASVHHYNGYGLLFGDSSELHYLSNKTRITTTLHSGVHALSNTLINSPWPRVKTGKRLLQELVSQEQTLRLEDLFQILTDDGSDYPTAINPIESTEPSTSPIFIRSNDYGTRCSTVILIDRESNVTFEERSFNRTSECYHSRQHFEFQINP